jgi:CubicO group peptidase (beta-lactamase class C family)
MQMKKIPLILIVFYAGACKIIYPAIHNIPKEKNGSLFPKRVISNGDSIFYFKESPIKNLAGKSIKVDEKTIDPSGVDLDEMVKLHHTLSFMIIRNDSILYENYAPKINDTTNLSGFSVAKSFVSTLIGMAIDNGEIRDVHQSLTDFIPELKDRGFTPITIGHLLKHTSGIHFTKQPFNPNSDNAQFYYSNNLRQRMLQMKIDEPPGLHFNYQSENYQLLGLVIERATHQTLSAYLQNKLWKPLGMEHPAFWSLDNSSTTGIEKAFCCLNASTRDFAKLGRLYLNKGNWNGKQLISEQWVLAATLPDTTEGGKFNFQYNWIAGPERYGSYYAAGLYGQYIYVYPKKNIIIVRFGKEDLSYNPAYWKLAFLQIIDQL